MSKWLFVALLSSGLALAQSGSQVFSVSNDRYALLLEWTTAGGQLTGSAQIVIVDPDVSGINLNVANATISGTVNGVAHAFAFSRPLVAPGVTALSGTLNGTEMLLRYPLTTGGFGALTLKKTSLSEFTRAVNSLKQGAAKTTQELQQAASASREEEATEQLKGRVTFALADSERLIGEVTTALGLLQQSMVNIGVASQSVKKAVERDCNASTPDSNKALIDDIRLEGENLLIERSYVSELVQSLEKNMAEYTAALQSLQSRLPANEYTRLTQGGRSKLAPARAAVSAATPVLSAAQVQATQIRAQVEAWGRALRC